MSNQKRKLGRRTIALLWCFVFALAIGILIYIEQIPVLYLLATVSLVVLLLIVAFSDLESVGRDDLEGLAHVED
ncbi:MAG: hypothetical protein ACT4O9_04690 [Blastocatellia bacterium]